MINSDYTFDAALLQQRTEAAQKNIQEKMPGTDFTQFAAKIIYDRIADKPEKYREFGVYWYAIKRVLQEQGFQFGTYFDESMIAQYRQDTDTKTLMAGEMFKDYYRENYFSGTNTFHLDDEVYSLVDEELELLI